MNILGLNAYHGDASAALFAGGRLSGAMEEERFTRLKHQAGFPTLAVQHALAQAGLTAADLDHIAISRDSNAHLHKKLLFALSKGPSLALLRNRLTNASKLRDVKASVAELAGVAESSLKAEVHRVEHHRAHMASAFFVSPFERAALLSIDGFGDFVSTMWGRGCGSTIEVDGWVEFPHSMGLLYTAITQYLGFGKYGDEFKVMGLAPYGQPEYLDALRRLVRVTANGGFELDLSYFIHHSEGVNMTWESGSPTIGDVFSPKLEALLGPRRRTGEPLEPKHQHIAASLQVLLEEVVLGLLRQLAAKTGLTDLCMAGGVALNCTMNGKIQQDTPFERVYIQPAAYDGGTSLGAALYVKHQVLGAPRDFVMDHTYWGLEYPPDKCRAALEAHGLRYRELEEEPLAEAAADLIAAGNIVGWYQGRFEWGPRALGNRSIVCDPRRADMKDILNSRIKHRESFRPFAPSVLEERAGEWFAMGEASPFMLMTCQVRPERQAQVPAITHVDGTARQQTVSRRTNPKYWALIDAFERKTGVPIVLNTSFNENEPVVNTPDEAIACYLRNDMDVLVLGPYLVEKHP
ncbi:MAG: carbamoyltransferase [Acidobacteria bacterium]|nr:carbamoyltransferase [Acidobacteriota bacterium]